MAGVYLTALFGIAGCLLLPESGFDLGRYLTDMRAVLNSVLIVRIGSSYSVFSRSRNTSTMSSGPG